MANEFDITQALQESENKVEEKKEEVKETRTAETQITKKQKSLSEVLTSALEVYGKDLDKGFKKDLFIANCITFIKENPDITKYKVDDVKICLMKGAILGLDFLRKECYAIPYGNILTFQTDYKGDVKVARRYAKRPIRDIYAQLVREGEKFEKKIVDNEVIINYEENPFSDGEPIGVFAIVRYEDGGVECETMSRKEIEDVRATFSKSKDSKAWKATWGEMAKKTCLRRLCKHITIDFESADRQLAFDEGSGMEFAKSKTLKAPDTKIDVIDISQEAVEVSESKE